MATEFTQQHRVNRLPSRKRLAQLWTLVLSRCMFMRSTMLGGRLSMVLLAPRFCEQFERFALGLPFR